MMNICRTGLKAIRQCCRCRLGSYDVAEDEPKVISFTSTDKEKNRLGEHEQEMATGEGSQTLTREVIYSKQTLNGRHGEEEQLRREMKVIENVKKDREDEIKDLKQENRKLEREKEEALLRLSELVSLKLRDNNPDIVDLSDAYRPTKLAEMFSELYDNEWTAAFIVMEEKGFKERQMIDFLLDILMESFIFCRTELDYNWQLINRWYLDDSLPNNDKVKKSLKDARKATIPNLVPEMEQKFRVMIGEKCKDETLCLILSTSAFIQYVATCIKLCLLMNANDPPVVISYPGWVSCEKRRDSTEGIDNQNMAQSDGSSTDTQEGNGNASSTGARETQRFSKDLFKEYTQRGKFVKFYVWPVIYLHENGPLLAKGIAQGKGKHSVPLVFVIYFLFRYTKWERRGTNTREFPYPKQIPQGTCDTDGYAVKLSYGSSLHSTKKVKRIREGRVTRADFRECLTIISSYFREIKCVKFLRDFVRGSEHQYTELRSVIIERENTEEVIHQLREEIEQKDNKIHDLQEINRATELDKRHAELDKQEALTRLSELMSVKLRDNKPNIADLNDPYRPTKLAEMFSELYDNEWTAFYTVLEESKFNDRHMINFLLDVFMLSFTFCKTELDANWQLVSKWYLDDNLPNNQAVKKALKDGRKSLVQRLVPEMENKLYTLLCDLCKLESLQFVLTSGEMKTYVAGCVKLSLMMNANDPPVAIDCPGWVPCISQKESIYQSKHEEESDLLKHEGNAQVLSNVEGDGSNQNNTSDLKERRSFNKELFKEYTVRGKYVEFFVWPVMYLHENGPVLAKGIAQGAEDKMVSDDDHRWEWWKTTASL